MNTSQACTVEASAGQANHKYRNEYFAADYLGLSPATLRRYRLNPGLGPKWYKLGASVRYTIEDLDAYACQQPAGGVAA